MDQQRFVDKLKRRGYGVTVFDTGAQAAAYLNEAIDGKTVGFGDSETMLSMGLYDRRGAIAAGKAADLAVLDDDLSVRGVVLGGKWIRRDF